MPASAAELVDLLDLETIDLNLFRGKQPHTRMQRVFGGQVAAQALVAANRTVPDEQLVHSLHSYFLRPGDTAVVAALEQQFDNFQAAREDSGLLGDAGQVPSAEELGAEFERFLADQDRRRPRD